MTATAILAPIRFCPKCQADTERSANGACKPCAKIYSAARRAANPDRSKASSASWKKANTEKRSVYGLAWRSANQEKTKEYDKAKRVANPERENARSAAWRLANPDRKKASDLAWRTANSDQEKARTQSWHTNNPKQANAGVKAWRKANPEAGRIYSLNRRARKRENGGRLSIGLVDRLFILQKGKCPCCGIPLGKDCHMDHIVPLSRGGSNTDNNIQLLRQRCNNQKHAKDPVDFMQSRGFLL